MVIIREQKRNTNREIRTIEKGTEIKFWNFKIQHLK